MILRLLTRTKQGFVQGALARTQPTGSHFFSLKLFFLVSLCQYGAAAKTMGKLYETGGATDADQLSGTTIEIFLTFLLALQNSRIKKNCFLFLALAKKRLHKEKHRQVMDH